MDSNLNGVRFNRDGQGRSDQKFVSNSGRVVTPIKAMRVYRPPLRAER